jgi:hypothetical protein
MSNTLPVEDRIAIETLLSELCHAVDSRQPAHLITLLSEDCSFDVGMGPAVGRDAIKAAFGPRALDTSYIARHTWSNLRILAASGNEVNVHSIFTTFAIIDLDADRKQVWRTGDAFDTFQRQPNGAWLLSARRLDAVVA